MKMSRRELSIDMVIHRGTFKYTKWLFPRLPHIKCIRLGYVRSNLHVFAPTTLNMTLRSSLVLPSYLKQGLFFTVRDSTPWEPSRLAAASHSDPLG